MGNCLNKPQKSTSEITPHDILKSSTAATVRLYSSASSSSAAASTFTCYYLRFALLFKNASLDVIPSEEFRDHHQLTLQIGSETVSGSRDTLVRFVDAKFPRPPLVAGASIGEDQLGETTPLVVRVVALQHRSMTWHLRRMVRWASDLATRKGRRSVDPVAGTQKMELSKFWSGYSQLLEVMLDHAQMEERVLFPLFELADRGICKAATREHARDLPIMNGIKEEIKCIGVMDTRCPDYREALCNLYNRLKSLQENCKGHFLEEERDVLPLVEAMELSKEQQAKVLEQCFDVMQGTHSHLFKFLIEGLLPREAMQYVDLILSCKGEEWAASLLRRIFD